MPRKCVPEEWLREHYPRSSIHDTLDAIEREFGWRPSKTAVYVRASKLGLKKEHVCTERRGDHAERVARWSKMPEEDAWMDAHDHGQRTDELADEFEAEFGWRLTRGQVNAWRARHGRQPHGRRRYGGRPRKPVGYERVSKDGYIVVKVADEADRAMSKDNWRLKQVWVWEQHNGPLPEGHVVYFADGDNRNFDPDNLVAVPRRAVGLLARMEYHDAESLRAAVALAMVRIKAKDVEESLPSTCAVCGRQFTAESAYRRKLGKRPVTCPDCLAAGHKACGNRRYDRAEMLRLYDSGMRPLEVAREMGCCKDLVCRAIRERGETA